MSILTIAWTAPHAVGLLPVDAGEVLETSLAVPWTPKQSTYVLPYDPDDLKQRESDPDPQVTNPVDVPAPPAPGDTGAGGGVGGGLPAPAPAPAPGVVRPATPAKVRAPGRLSPVSFRARGIRVRVTLREPARVTLHLEATVKKRLSTRRATRVKRRLTTQRTLPLKAGTTTLRLRPTATGRRVITRSSRVRSSLVITTRHRDGRKVTARRTVTIAPAAKATKTK
jgi:hypothetical protein